MAFYLGSVVIPNPAPLSLYDRINAVSPWVRRILKETKRIQVEIAKENHAEIHEPTAQQCRRFGHKR